MNARELAVAISEALEDTVRIDTTPKVKKDFASLECEDDEGHTFFIRITRLASEDADNDDDDDVGEGVIVDEGDDAEL